MWKKLVVGAAMLAVLGSSSVWAQPAPRPPMILFSREDAGAFLEARIAALHAGLQLTPEQERIWPPFEQAYRERGKLRIAGATTGAPAPEQESDRPPAAACRRVAAARRRAQAPRRRRGAIVAELDRRPEAPLRGAGAAVQPAFRHGLRGAGRAGDQSGTAPGPRWRPVRA